MIPAAAIVAECKRRGYAQTETIAILTLALDQTWTVIDPLALNRYETARDGHNSPWPDAYYCIAASRGLPAGLWQAFKDTLYQHIDQAAALYADPGAPIEEDPLSALSDEEARALVADVKALRTDVANFAAQFGPTLPGWPSLGKNAKGQELTWRDAFGVVKADVAAIKTKLLG